METMIYILFVLFCGSYFMFLGLCFWNWKTNSVSKSGLMGKEPFVSVIIAFKDEEKVLGKLLKSLSKQSYKNYEVILVNDHSQDDFSNVIKPFLCNRVSVYHQEEGKKGKKYALELGVSKAKGEFVLFSDADCDFSEDWVSSMSGEIGSENVDWLAGSIRYEISDGVLSFFQAMESAYLVMISAFTITKKIPTTCNGANIIIRKEAFLSLNGFEDLRESPSGDDELFMQKLFKRGRTISYNYKSEACVSTESAKTWSGLFTQRVRWGSKLKYNLLPYNFMLSVLVFGFHVFVFFLLFYDIKLFLVALTIRFVLELWGGLLFFKCNRMNFNLYYFIISFLVYPLYVIFMAVATQFSKYTWKGREY